jgi:hypothetical protein
MRLVLTPSVSVPLSFLFYLGFKTVLGGPSVFPALAGFIFGYLSYDIMHFTMQHLRWNNPIWLIIKNYHILHHYHEHDKGFGVSSPLWDYIFSTRFNKFKKQKAMKKLILVNIAMAFALSLFAQNDTAANRVVQEKILDGLYRKNLNRDTAFQGLNMGNLKNDTLFDGKYSNKATTHDDRLKRDTTPYDGKNNKVKMDTMMDKMGKHDMNKMGKHDMNKMGKHDMDKMGNLETNKIKSFRGVMMKDGKVMIVKNGKMTIIKNYTVLDNGTKAMSDGSIVKTDGTKTMINEGEYINMAGDVVSIEDIRMKDRHQK